MPDEGKSTCIDCGAEVSSNVARCAACTAKALEKMLKDSQPPQPNGH